MSQQPAFPPEVRGPVPGPRSRALALRLADVECRNVTCLAPAPPIFWERAEGANVWDVDGNCYVDLGGAFGVANAGHARPEIVAAVARQSARLMHGMGDVHPSSVKVELLEAISARFPGGHAARATLGSSGSDAVEIALKTALLSSGKAGVIAFEGAYHGLALGALDVTWRGDFREPFRARLPEATVFAPYGGLSDARSSSDDPAADIEAVEAVAESSREPVGAVIVEPVQGRGGERVPRAGWLGELRALCDRRGWLLIVDEVYTGFGRTGALFACQHDDVVPDLLCLGKGLASGVPISACVGRAEVMAAWPASRGEALHTQTFLGHPVACAAALASIAVIEADGLVSRSADLGAAALERLTKRLAHHEGVVEVRGRGLMIGIECDSGERAQRACQRALELGVILLPSGPNGCVLSITPPLSIEEGLLGLALDRLCEAIP